jgi:putative endonuclease
MTKTAKRQVGDIGEDVVCKYLDTKGFRVLERNYLRKWGEIDIVAEKGQLLSFIEVKSVSREPGDGFRPEENMHYQKVQRLRRAIQTYLLDRKIKESQKWQFDLVCVYLDEVNKKAKIKVLENIIL